MRPPYPHKWGLAPSGAATHTRISGVAVLAFDNDKKLRNSWKKRDNIPL
jgi:hypothetical protein